MKGGLHPRDIPTSEGELRQRLFTQDERLVMPTRMIAEHVGELPHEPAFAHKPRALLVGGFVRDAALGLKPKDADMEVYGVSPQRLEALLEELFPKRVNAIGRAFGVFRVVVQEGMDIDVSLPRKDSKIGRGHKGFEIHGDPDMSPEDAARRRDFTVNAILADPLTGEFIDPYHGLEDLRKGILRVTDQTCFQDDPLRVYRALQFAARFDLTPETRTRELLREMVARGDLSELPKERVTEEIRKLLLSERPSIGFELARDLGIIKKDYPELQALIDCPQEAEWHPEGDVWVHTMMVVDEAAKIIRDPQRALTDTERIQVMLGALCHDLGKPLTTAFEEGRTRSRGHEEAGEVPAKTLCAKWSFSQLHAAAAVAVAREHLKPSMFLRAYASGHMNDANYVNAVRRLIKRIYPTSWRVLIAASEADSRGRGIAGVDTEPYEAGERFAEAVRKNRLDEEPTRPLLGGKDLLALGIKPGPGMGEAIKHVEHARDRGEIRTREEAIEYLKAKGTGKIAQ